MIKKDYSKPLVNIDSIGHEFMDGLELIEAINKTLPKEKLIFQDYTDINKAPEERNRGITINTAYLKEKKR